MARLTKKMGSRARWNLVDLIVILLVFICLLGAIIRVGGKDWFVGGSDLREYEIYFSVTDIAYTSEDALVIGDTVTLCDSGAVLGELKSIDSILPSTLYVKDADGNVLSVNYPESIRIDVTGTVSSRGRKTDNGYLLGGTAYLAPGKAYRVQTEHMDFTMNILDIE
ncbi:MAG: DUF4330 domain-containing protein [Clostridia bacterium]|nr:DUF4330 domain-containing protein [Clostridia bacterium]